MPIEKDLAADYDTARQLADRGDEGEQEDPSQYDPEEAASQPEPIRPAPREVAPAAAAPAAAGMERIRATPREVPPSYTTSNEEPNVQQGSGGFDPRQLTPGKTYTSSGREWTPQDQYNLMQQQMVQALPQSLRQEYQLTQLKLSAAE